MVESGPYYSLDKNLIWTMSQLAQNASQVIQKGSVFEITDMVTIESSDTLIIPPGTTIKVNKDIRIDIKGKLIAEGAQNNTILFTSASPTPTAGDWKALRFNDAKPSVLRYVTIQYAYDGVYIYKGNHTIENNIISDGIFRGIYCWLDNSTIRNNTIFNFNNPNVNSLDEGVGIRVYQSKAYVSKNTVFNTEKYGIKVEYSNNTIYGNNVSQTKYGIHILRSEPLISNNYVWNNSQGITMWENVGVKVYDNYVVNNIQFGIYFHRTAVDIYQNVIESSGTGVFNYQGYKEAVIRNNEIILNEAGGITLETITNVTIIDNYIWHNSYEPIFAVSVKNLIIENNTIKRNEDDGIEIKDSFNVRLWNNFIDDNRGGSGIHLDNVSDITISKNTIKDAGFHGMKIENSDISLIEHNEITQSHQKDVWLINSNVCALNLSFDLGKVVCDPDSTFLLKNYLDVRVQNQFQEPIMGANVTVMDGSRIVFDKKTNVLGYVNDMLLVDLMFNRSSSFKDNVTTVKVAHPDFIFDNNPRVVNMSFSHTEVFGKNRKATVHITRPSNLDTVKGRIFINGTSRDPDGLIETVEISINNGNWMVTKSLGLYWSKWSFEWNSTDVIDGEHTINARVYDGMNYSYDSIKLIVKNELKNNSEPLIYVVFYNPVEEQVITGDIRIIGHAFSNIGTVISVEIKIDDGPFKMTEPDLIPIKEWDSEKGEWVDTFMADWNIWGYTWNSSNATTGPHTITAKVTDSKNNVDLEEVNVIVDNSKTDIENIILEITHPSNNDILTGKIEISGKLWGFGTDDPNLRLRINEDQWFTPTDLFYWYGFWIFNHLWDTTIYPNGIHEIMVKAGSGTNEVFDNKIVLINNGGTASTFGIKITSPDFGEEINGTYEVRGYIWNYEREILGINYRINNGEWQDVSGFDTEHISTEPTRNSPSSRAGIWWTYWYIFLNTSLYNNGIHLIKIKAWDITEVITDSTMAVIFNEDGIPDPGSITEKELDKILDIKIYAPENGDLVKDNVKIKGIAWARFGGITSVEIQIDKVGYVATYQVESNWTQWEYIWDTRNHKNGPHTIGARIIAKLGEHEFIKNSLEIVPIVINDEQGPGVDPLPDIDVIILYPAENETIKGIYEIYGIGWVSSGSIKDIQLKIDSGSWLQASAIHQDFLTWNYQLNSSKYKNGVHNLTARLNTGTSLISSTIIFYINNTGSQVGPDDPDDPDDPDGDPGDPTQDPQKGRKSQSPESDLSLVKGLLAAIIVIIFLLMLMFIYILRTKKQLKKDIEDKPGELDGDRVEPIKEKELLEPKEEDKEEIDAAIFEEEDDDVIVIKGDLFDSPPPVIKKKSIPKPFSGPKRVVGRKPKTRLTAAQLKELPLTRPVGSKRVSTLKQKSSGPKQSKMSKSIISSAVEKPIRKTDEKKAKPKTKPQSKLKQAISGPKEKPISTAEAAPIASSAEGLKVEKIAEAKAISVTEEMEIEETAPAALPLAEEVSKPEPKKETRIIGSEEKLTLLDKKLKDGKISQSQYNKLKSRFITHVEETKTDQASADIVKGTKKPPMNCPSCNNPPKYIEKYHSWYCTGCKKYVVREVVKNN